MPEKLKDNFVRLVLIGALSMGFVDEGGGAVQNVAWSSCGFDYNIWQLKLIQVGTCNAPATLLAGGLGCGNE
jgi:hypothetical protein